MDVKHKKFRSSLLNYCFLLLLLIITSTLCFGQETIAKKGMYEIGTGVQLIPKIGGQFVIDGKLYVTQKFSLSTSLGLSFDHINSYRFGPKYDLISWQFIRLSLGFDIGRQQFDYYKKDVATYWTVPIQYGMRFTEMTTLQLGYAYSRLLGNCCFDNPLHSFSVQLQFRFYKPESPWINMDW